MHFSVGLFMMSSYDIFYKFPPLGLPCLPPSSSVVILSQFPKFHLHFPCFIICVVFPPPQERGIYLAVTA